MNAVAQIFAYCVSLACVLFFGNIFDTIFWQVGLNAVHRLNGKPLPAVTQFFVERSYLPAYLAVLPWLLMVGAPLLTERGAQRFWNPAAFAVRYLVFLTIELLLFPALTLFAFLPFASTYSLLSSSGDDDLLQTFMRWICWLLVAVIALLILWRVKQSRHQRGM